MAVSLAGLAYIGVTILLAQHASGIQPVPPLHDTLQSSVGLRADALHSSSVQDMLNHLIPSNSLGQSHGGHGHQSHGGHDQSFVGHGQSHVGHGQSHDGHGQSHVRPHTSHILNPIVDHGAGQFVSSRGGPKAPLVGDLSLRGHGDHGHGLHGNNNHLVRGNVRNHLRSLTHGRISRRRRLRTNRRHKQMLARKYRLLQKKKRLAKKKMLLRKLRNIRRRRNRRIRYSRRRLNQGNGMYPDTLIRHGNLYP